ncbi:hypothetical protein CGW93_03940 [candidate division bacterium WOR-3 4484_18]|uniref:Glycosyltransferase 2-like domain-containing protein n=1 Tax=candidate division WOR-3 bacterium 4484_18 TaxID=2020626 RepID=A0A257LTL6_UNCW3|nr:MAG: hypothetical protein CGW93_03940 [candidate division bacterium WOR-3 4484_18]
MAAYVSVVIVTYNRHDALLNVIEDVKQQQTTREFEIIVVDQSDTPLVEPPNDVRYIRLNTPSMVRARNRGISIAKGQLVVFIDDDVRIPDVGWLKELCHTFEIDDNIAGVAGRVTHMRRLSHPMKVFLRFDIPDVVKPVDTLIGCNMAVRKDCVIEVGGFDENFMGSCQREETEISLRLRKRGWKIYYNGKAQLMHLGLPAGGARSYSQKERHFYYFFNQFYFFFKHFRHTYWPMFVLLNIVDILHMLRQVWVDGFPIFMEAVRSAYLKAKRQKAYEGTTCR